MVMMNKYIYQSIMLIVAGFLISIQLKYYKYIYSKLLLTHKYDNFTLSYIHIFSTLVAFFLVIFLCRQNQIKYIIGSLNSFKQNLLLGLNISLSCTIVSLVVNPPLNFLISGLINFFISEILILILWLIDSKE